MFRTHYDSCLKVKQYHKLTSNLVGIQRYNGSSIRFKHQHVFDVISANPRNEIQHTIFSCFVVQTQNVQLVPLVLDAL